MSASNEPAVLVCDDSTLARNQVARLLPSGWSRRLAFAADGAEALDRLRESPADLVFLDLHMPVMDGFEALRAIRDAGLEVPVVVLSGDAQPEAMRRAAGLGARAFVKKPADAAAVRDAIARCGLEVGDAAPGRIARAGGEIDLIDGYCEIVNVAMGSAVALLSRVLGAYVTHDVPKVNVLEPSELRMTLGYVGDDDAVTAVAQGFAARGIAGEALLVFDDASFVEMARMTERGPVADAALELEMLMDAANVLIGACVKGIGEQLDLEFHRGLPAVVGRRTRTADLVAANAGRWTPTLAAEVPMSIEGHELRCDLLVLHPETSTARLHRRIVEVLG